MGDIDQSGGGRQSNMMTQFMNHVFNFESDSKNEMMNLLQFGILAIIPVIVLNKSIHNFVPDASHMKGTIELTFEVVGQTAFMLIGLLLIEKVVTFIPTYSGMEYDKTNKLTMVLPFLMILLSLQSKLGDKANILYKRLMNAWNGNSTFESFEDEDGNENGGNQQPNTSQPIAGQGQGHGVGPPNPVVQTRNDAANVALNGGGGGGVNMGSAGMQGFTNGGGRQGGQQQMQVAQPPPPPAALMGGMGSGFSSGFSEF